jgi:crotonobetainyl-CoA:carnitine CoA-transferase CaiB-like acyl-CoA transferase
MRVANREELDRIITEAIKDTAAEELDALLQENKVPGGRILNI